MTSVVRPAPGCRLDITARAIAAVGGARVTETVAVSAPPPLLGYMARQAEFARGRLYERLSDALGTLNP